MRRGCKGVQKGAERSMEGGRKGDHEPPFHYRNCDTWCRRGCKGVRKGAPKKAEGVSEGASLHLRTHKYPERYIGCDGRGTAGNEKGVLGKGRCPIE